MLQLEVIRRPVKSKQKMFLILDYPFTRESNRQTTDKDLKLAQLNVI